MTKIVVLDGYTLNPGDISWRPFESLGTLSVYDRSAVDQIAERASGAACLITNKASLDDATMSLLPELRYIGVTATGTNVVDLDAASARGVTVTNVPGYSAQSVAQHAIALLLHLASRVAEHDAAVHDGAWASCDDWTFSVAPQVELAGKTLGIIGMGSIGSRVARIASAMGMKIVSVNRDGKKKKIHGVKIEWLGLDDLFARADAITLHCPLTEQTHHLINTERLAKMKPTAFLINTGRGPLIDEVALAEALHSSRIAGAALDVLNDEPPHADHPLLIAPRCVITPHNAWATLESRSRLMDMAAANLKAFIDGQPVNVVNEPVTA